MTAQQDRIDREMLRSMSASLSSGLEFSFNRQDMAEMLSRVSFKIDPKPRIATPDPRIEGWNAAIEAASEVYGKPFHSGGVAKSMAHFVYVDDHRKYQEACAAYRDAIRAIPCPYTPKEGK